MKLHEIASRDDYDPSDDAPHNPVVLDVDLDDPFDDGVKVKVKYKATKGHKGSYDEPADPGDLDILKVTLDEPLKSYDEDGEVKKTWPKGTDVDDIDGWTRKFDDKVSNALDLYLSKG